LFDLIEARHILHYEIGPRPQFFHGVLQNLATPTGYYYPSPRLNHTRRNRLTQPGPTASNQSGLTVQ
jgi:hypothetical protein